MWVWKSCVTRPRVQVSKGARIRQGSPEEEAALAAHIAALAPTPAALAALGELSEALVVLGHADDARVLQAAMAALLAAQEVCPHCLPRLTACSGSHASHAGPFCGARRCSLR